MKSFPVFTVSCEIGIDIFFRIRSFLILFPVYGSGVVEILESKSKRGCKGLILINLRSPL